MGIAKFANSWTLKDKNVIFPHLRHQMYFQIFVERFENQDTSDCWHAFIFWILLYM